MVLVMYIVLRRDLLSTLNWPIGALVAQACHATTALLWEFRTDEDVQKYMSQVDTMKKVVLETENEESLKSISEKLKNENLDHRMWIEQPENIPVCVAVKPYPKSRIHPHLKHLKLFS